MSNRIVQLTDETAASVRAGQVIGSISRAVEELVRNAVEHGRCSNVVVTLGGKRSAHHPNANHLSFLQVQDDGTGIDAVPLRRYVGTEYCSSSVSGRHKHPTAVSGWADDGAKRRRRSRENSPHRHGGSSESSTTTLREKQSRHYSGAATLGSRDASDREPFSVGVGPDGNELVTRREDDSSIIGEQTTSRGESLKALANLCVEMRISTRTTRSTGYCGGGRKRKSDDEENNPPWSWSLQKASKESSSSATDESLYCSRKIIRNGVEVEFSSGLSSLLGSSAMPGPTSRRRDDSSLQKWRRKREKDTATKKPNVASSTGTTVSLEGLFYTHAVRKRHYHRERLTSKSSDRKNGGNTNGTYTGERADIGQVRACLRTLSLAYPSVSFHLENGRTRSTVASWPAYYAPVPTTPSQHSDRSVLRRTARRNPKDDEFRSILSRLRQVCGEALADVGDGQYVPISYAEAPSNFSREASKHGRKRGSKESGADRTRSRPRVKSRTSGVASHEEHGSDIWKVVGIVCHREVCGTNSSKHCQTVFVNGRVAQHASKLASIVQNEYISRSSTPCVAENTTVGVYFVLHVSCQQEEADVVIDETCSTMAVTKRDYLEHLLRTSVSVAFQTRRGGGGYGLGASCDIEQKSALRRTKRVATASSIFTASGNPTRLVSGKLIGSASSPHFSTVPSATSVDERTRSEHSTSDCTMVKDSSPFSNAFMGDTEETSAGVSFVSSLDVTFEDAFCGRTRSDLGREASIVPASNAHDENDTTDESLEWTRNRLRALESQITSIMAPTAEATKGQGMSISITKEMLSNADVIAQLDAKFIIINAGGLLCVVDQHAGDERIRLERLEAKLAEETDKFLSVDGPASGATNEDETLLKSVLLVPAQAVRLSPTQLACVTQHEKILTRWRFAFDFPSNDGSTVLLNGVPCVCGKKATTTDFIQYVQALCSSTADASVVKPAFVKRVLASHACRYAIMFGDVLSHSKCVDLIRSLSKCDLSFVCAHGRPSVVPLLDMRGIGRDKVRPGASAHPFDITSSFARNKNSNSVPLGFRPSRVMRKQKI